MVARFVRDEEVAGSNPVIPTKHENGVEKSAPFLFKSATPPRLSTGCLPAVCTGSRCHYAFKGQRNILAVIDLGVIDIEEWSGRDNAGRNHSTYGRSGRLGRAAYRRGGSLHQGQAPHELPGRDPFGGHHGFQGSVDCRSQGSRSVCDPWRHLLCCRRGGHTSGSHASTANLGFDHPLASITAAGVVLFLVIAALVASAAAKRESLTK